MMVVCWRGTATNGVLAWSPRVAGVAAARVRGVARVDGAAGVSISGVAATAHLTQRNAAGLRRGDGRGPGLRGGVRR